MAEKVTKTVEIELTTNDSKLKSGVATANKTLSELKSTQAKGNKQSDRDQVKRDREEKFRQGSKKKSDRTQTQARNRELQILKKIAKTEKNKTAELKKQTAELEKQARLQGKMGKGGAGGGAGGGGAGGGPAGDALAKVDSVSSAGGLAKTILGKAVLAAFGTMVGVAGSQIRSGYQTFVEAEKAQAPLAAATRDRSGFKAAATEGYAKYGYVRAETARQALDMARQTGNVKDTSFAQMVSRSGSGLGVGGATDLMGLLTRSGQKGFTGTDAKGKRELETIIARGMDAGLTKNEAIGRMPEFVSSVERLVKRQGTVAAGDVTSKNVARLLAFFGQSGLSGLQGARGGEVLNKIDTAIRRPGGGEAGEAFMMRAFGFGTPGGTTEYMDARRRMQQGISGEGNLAAFIRQAEAEKGRGDFSTRYLEEITKLSIVQIEAVKKLIHEGVTDPQKIKEEIVKFEKAKETTKERLEGITEADDFAGTAKKLATLTQHLDDIGKKVFEPIHGIQENINTLVKGNIEVLVGVLDAAKTGSDALVDTAETLNEIGADLHDFFHGDPRAPDFRKPGSGLEDVPRPGDFGGIGGTGGSFMEDAAKLFKSIQKMWGDSVGTGDNPASRKEITPPDAYAPGADREVLESAILALADHIKHTNLNIKEVASQGPARRPVESTPTTNPLRGLRQPA